MKVGIYEDELWPYYGIMETGTHDTEMITVTQATLDRWYAAIEAFRAVQEEMGKRFLEAEKKRLP